MFKSLNFITALYNSLRPPEYGVITVVKINLNPFDTRDACMRNGYRTFVTGADIAVYKPIDTKAAC